MKELLTGKCKEAFEKWYFREIPKEKSQWNDFIKASLWADFKYASFSMQYGVYLEFFDNVKNIEILVISNYDLKNSENYWEFCINDMITNNPYKTRQEAQQQAIIKANEIYNAK